MDDIWSPFVCQQRDNLKIPLNPLNRNSTIKKRWEHRAEIFSASTGKYEKTAISSTPSKQRPEKTQRATIHDWFENQTRHPIRKHPAHRRENWQMRHLQGHKKSSSPQIRFHTLRRMLQCLHLYSARNTRFNHKSRSQFRNPRQKACNHHSSSQEFTANPSIRETASSWIQRIRGLRRGATE